MSGKESSSSNRRNKSQKASVAKAIEEMASKMSSWEMEELLGNQTTVSAAVTGMAAAMQMPLSAQQTDDPFVNLGDQQTTAPDFTTEAFDLLDEEEEEDEPKGWKHRAKLILPHIGLILLTASYTIIGAGIFYAIENPSEAKFKQIRISEILRMQQDLLADMFRSARTTTVSEAEWSRRGKEQLNNITELMFVSFDKGFLTAKEITLNATYQIWTFPTAIFFAVTVVTTIGYGNPVPLTFAGKLICIFFALFGIPLTLVTIADVGKFFSEHLIWIYGKMLQGKHWLTTKCKKWRQKRMAKKCEANHAKGPAGPHCCDRCKLNEDLVLLQVDRTIPASMVLVVLVVYTAFGGFLMRHLEGWSFFESFYFSFITMTTVGFGDMNPKTNRIQLVLLLLYMLLGLVVTTMCIDLVGVQYIRKIHYMGRKIQDAKTALGFVGGRAIYLSDIFGTTPSGNLRRRNPAREAYILENLLLARTLIPFIPGDIRGIHYIDEGSESIPSSTMSLEPISTVNLRPGGRCGRACISRSRSSGSFMNRGILRRSNSQHICRSSTRTSVRQSYPMTEDAELPVFKKRLSASNAGSKRRSPFKSPIFGRILRGISPKHRATCTPATIELQETLEEAEEDRERLKRDNSIVLKQDDRFADDEAYIALHYCNVDAIETDRAEVFGSVPNKPDQVEVGESAKTTPRTQRTELTTRSSSQDKNNNEFTGQQNVDLTGQQGTKHVSWRRGQECEGFADDFVTDTNKATLSTEPNGGVKTSY